MSQPTPRPYQLLMVYDIRSWIEEYAEELHAHTVPKCFKFERNDAGKAMMFYRNWSHEEWQGPVVILKVNICCIARALDDRLNVTLLDSLLPGDNKAFNNLPTKNVKNLNKF